MSETLTTPRPRAEAPDPTEEQAAEHPTTERAPDTLEGLEEDLAKMDAERLESARDRVEEIINGNKAKAEQSPAETLVMDRVDEGEPADGEALDDGQEKKGRVRRALRKIGDAALSVMERVGKSKVGQYISRKLELWGLTPLRGTWHKQPSVSGWIARKYLQAQQNRHDRLKAGFLSSEQAAEVGDDEEPEERTERSDSPDKPEKAEQKSKSEKDGAESEPSEEKPEESEPESKEEDAEVDEPKKPEADPSDDQEAEPAKDENEPDDKEETEPKKHEAEANPETDDEAAKNREEAHQRAEAASARKAERKERRPLKERAGNLMQRLKGLKGRIGAAAVRTYKRAKASAAAATNAWKTFGND